MKRFLTYLLVPIMLVTLMVSGANARSPKASLNLSSSGLALRGYDPVAYFTVGKPVKGKSSISTKSGGGTYYFSSEGNKALFVKNPQKYKPKYGGYCAYGAAVKSKINGNPTVWHIVNGRLYLNVNRSVDRTWSKKRGSYIKKANRNWPKIKNR